MAATDNRVCHLLEELEQILVDFIREHDVTHAEYRTATELIIASVKAGEESLLFDVFLEAESVDNDNLRHQGTIEAIEGPFYLPGAPILEPPFRLPRRADENGQALIFSGRVIDTDGNAIAEAELDIWQADATGRYSNIQYPTEGPTIPRWNLRGRLTAASDGYFVVRTILPPPYEIPKHGPTGVVLAAVGRHVYRPAHLHVKVRHPGYREVTVQLYFADGDYLDSDVARAVREALIMRVEPVIPAGERRSASRQWLKGSFDFVLERVEPEA